MNEESVIPSAQISDISAPERVSWWAWWRQWARGDAAKTAFGAWLALRCYCTFIGVVLYYTVPAKVYTSDMQIAFSGHIASCPQYTTTAVGLNGALAGMWLRWDTPWYLEIAAHGYSCYGSSAF